MIHACQLYKRLQVSLVGLFYSLQKGIVYVFKPQNHTQGIYEQQVERIFYGLSKP